MDPLSRPAHRRPRHRRTSRARTTRPPLRTAGLAVAGLAALLLTACTGAPRVAAGPGEGAPSGDPTAAHGCAAEPVAVFIGDSFTVGAGVDTEAERWTTIVARQQGWEEINQGVSGSSYAVGGALRPGTAYVERTDEAVAAEPDIVIVSTAANSADTDQRAAIDGTLSALRAGLPDTPILATSPFHRDDVAPERLDELGEEIRSAAEAHTVEYLDLGYPLRGTADTLSDGLHPNAEGYSIIAGAFLAAYSAHVPSGPAFPDCGGPAD